MNAPRMSSLTLLALALALQEPRRGTAADRKPQPEAEPSVDSPQQFGRAQRVIDGADAYADLHGLARQTGMDPAHQRKRSRMITNERGGQVVVITDSCPRGEPLLVLCYLSEGHTPNITFAMSQFVNFADRDELYEKIDGEMASAIFTSSMITGDGGLVAVAVPIG